ncbi:class I SAM-dependent methyltransferase [Actinoallomurus bryophytorum]|uniref:Methyltransferase family protein n=1 Tax=Actinoallomurus bryophytorum TaxID=1490222 RepID=A0A543CLI8_9ACTN|nr:methyltransferase [Actinoallomurus bryophytorum]TQL97959.1 methyltransferase family protein [Actinoallomurus bryophytorum]
MPDRPARVRDLFEQAGYTVDGVRDLLGPVAGAALARDEIVPALRAARGDTPLETLLRLFWLQVPVPGAALDFEDLTALGLVERDGDEVRARLHVEPVESTPNGYVVSDLKARPGGSPLRDDHVVGQGGASANLAQLVVHRPVDNLLDLGTGSGVQAVHLAGRAQRITATDLNPRALELAALSFALSGVEAELLAGDLFAPVEGREFDLIVSNPPFVISPDRRFGYRESGLQGDEVCRRLVRQAPRHLAEDGWCHLLANWLHVDGEDWHDRVAGWIEGVDGWAVQRDVQDPAEYAELWLRDSCEAGTPEYRERYDAWLEHFERHKVTGVGFGWITLHRGDGREDVRVEDLRHAVDLPVGAYVEDLMRGRTDLTPATMLRTADGVVQEQVGPPGAEDPERIVLRQTRGLRRAAQVGTVEAALAGACDGDLPLGPLLEAIAQLTGADPGVVRERALAVMPDLVADGFFDIIG